VLTQEENETLTRVGKGTPMGELLRRYWHPIAAVTEFEDRTTKQVRLMGEDLVLYRDRSGTYGLIDLHCPHRRADLSYGFVEECGLRCTYHGWKFDEAGNCISQPFEDMIHENRRFRDSIKITAYPVTELAGMLFAYLGPEPAPICPNWELFTYENGFRQIVLAPVDCNWMQCAENDIDPVHFEWLHNNWSLEQSGKIGERAPRHVRIGIDDWEFGFGYKRILENTDETSPLWTQPRLHMMPAIFMPGGTHFEYRVPVDDEHTLSVVWSYEAVPLDMRPFVQTRIPHWYANITDPLTGRWISTHVINQDTIAWIGQGIVADRTKEHLAVSDLGVRKFRKQLWADLEAVAEGRDPMGVIRDPDRTVVNWPDNRRVQMEKGLSREDWTARRRQFRQNPLTQDDYFAFYAGQPEDVRKAYEEAMGI
jgi:5,5'-dehydrodivanillate O-demethylase oxygenase subunit